MSDSRQTLRKMVAKAPKPTGGGAAKKKVAPITPGAKQRLRDSGAIKLRKAIGRVEGHPVTEAVLFGGMG